MMHRQPVGQTFPALGEIVANPIPQYRNDGDDITLALDLSTRCIGFAVGKDKSLMRHGKLVFRSTAGTGEKLVYFEHVLKVFLKTFGVNRLLVEKPASRRGDVTARHCELLGIVRKVWAEMREGADLAKSWVVSALTVKATMKVRRGRDHDHNKQIMVDEINELCGLRLHYHRGSKLQSDDDVADAIAVLLTYYRRMNR